MKSLYFQCFAPKMQRTGHGCNALTSQKPQGLGHQKDSEEPSAKLESYGIYKIIRGEDSAKHSPGQSSKCLNLLQLCRRREPPTQGGGEKMHQTLVLDNMHHLDCWTPYSFCQINLTFLRKAHKNAELIWQKEETSANYLFKSNGAVRHLIRSRQHVNKHQSFGKEDTP